MKVKVCGMCDSENIQELVKLSPDYIGFIFYEKSKRFVTDFPKVEIPSTIKKVGVFVNESIKTIAKIVVENNLDAVQLHGGESVIFCNELKCHSELVEESHRFEIIKAFSIDKHFDFNKTNPYKSICDLFIFDTKGAGYGGTGKKYDWNLLKKYEGDTSYLLSGGIGPDDVEMVLSFIKNQKESKCIGVDLNSGFEDASGLKNIEKLKEFKARLYEE